VKSGQAPLIDGSTYPSSRSAPSERAGREEHPEIQVSPIGEISAKTPYQPESLTFHAPTQPFGRAALSPEIHFEPQPASLLIDSVVTFQHPASLNSLERYQQAHWMLVNSSRATNPAWYHAALDLDLQLHIRIDGLCVSSFLYVRHKEQWLNGPAITESDLTDITKLEACVAAVLTHVRTFKASSLGVILHLADEFTTAELKPALDNPAALPDLRMAAVQNPASILDDSSIPPGQNSWRVLPYPAQGSGVIGTTITITRKYAPFLQALRQAGESSNFPVATHALSAPLIAIMGLAQCAPFAPGRSAVAILQYPWFSVLAIFNEHADLLLLRTLQHRHLRQAPNLRQALTTTYASLELKDPDLFILPLGLSLDPGLHRNLCGAFPQCRVAIVTSPTPEVIPNWCLEPLIAAIQPNNNELTNSLTFRTFRSEKWALQDFLPPTREVVEVHPTRVEMQLLRGLRLARMAFCVLTLTMLAWFALGIVNIIRSDAWAFDPNQAGVIKNRLSNLTRERQKSEHWDNLLADRSKAWTSMELLSRLFPEHCGVLLKSFAHTVRPESPPTQTKIGFVKEWRITGLAHDEAVDHLNTLNTQEGIAAQFSEVARVTSNSAYSPTARTRSLAINVRTQENSSFKPLPAEETIDTDESTYPFIFDLTITQRFEGTDPLAINIDKAP